MVKVHFSSDFEKTLSRIKDNSLKDRIKKQIFKIISSPSIGKPMRYSRKGTREVYVKPFRLSYVYLDDEIVFFDLYHKDYQ